MLPRLALFFLVAFLALIVAGAEDYYKVCKGVIRTHLYFRLSCKLKCTC